MSLSYTQSLVNDCFASDLNFNDKVLEIPRPVSICRHQRAHHSVDSLRALPKLDTQSTRSEILTSSRSSISEKTGGSAANVVTSQIDLDRKRAARGVLADWFNGESRPLSLSIFPSSAKDMDQMEAISLSPSYASISSTHGAVSDSFKPTTANRFPFFSSKCLTPKSDNAFAKSYDELLNLNVTNVVFSSDPSDPSSTAAGKKLIKNVEDVVSRLQAALKESIMACSELRADKEAQSKTIDDLTIHRDDLKIQLNGMTTRLSEQDHVIMNLVDELAHEKQVRREEGHISKQGITLVGNHEVESDGPSVKKTRARIPPPPPPPHQGGCSSTVSDSGFESEDENSVSSISLRNQAVESPGTSVPPCSLKTSPDVSFQPKQTAGSRQSQSPQHKTPIQKLSPFQNVIKGFSRKPQSNEPVTLANQSQVSNLHRSSEVQVHEAWNIVELLQAENRALKQRVDCMEGALNDCLEELTLNIGK